MRMELLLLSALVLPLQGCGTAEVVDPDTTPPSQAAQIGSEGLTRKEIPTEDPGPPFYARVTSILNQFFHDDGWLAIPFYRDPSCVPPDFNLLELFDFPGPAGPGAFACPLLLRGFLLTEPDAPPTRFPRQVELTGDAVPLWIVSWNEFEDEAQDGVVTFADLEGMEPMVGTAHWYHETLKPRDEDHVIVIDAEGTLEDGRTFGLHVTHVQDRTRSVQLTVR